MSVHFHNATAEEIESFCDEMRSYLVEANERWPGCVRLSWEQFFKEITSAVPTGFPAVVGHQYVGASWAAQVGEKPRR